MSATPDSTFTSPEQRITDLERQLAEREAELAEAREQQAATDEILEVINASPGDLKPVFDVMLEKALRLCGASFGQLHMFDGERFEVLAVRGLTGAAAAERIRRPLVPDPGGALARVFAGERVVHIPDLVDTDAYRSGVASRRRLVEETGARTALWVALCKDNAVHGAFVIYRREVRPFSDKQITLLQNFAAQAVIAMDNARLITETREALEQQTATAEVLGVINSSPGELSPVFDAILERAHTLCGAPLGSLVLYDGENLRGVATRGYSSEYARLVHEGGPAGLVPAFERLVNGEQVVHEPDAAAHPLSMSTPLARAAVEIAGVRTLLLVPLRKDDALLGYISAQRREVRPFTDKQIVLLQNFAAQAVIAMENARLITETREALEQQTATAEVLGVINSSPGDLAPVFDAMLEKAMRLCEASFGMMNTYDGAQFHAVAVRGVPAALAEFRARNPLVFVPGTAPALIVAGETVVHRRDAMDEESYRDGDPMMRGLVDLGGARTLLVVALRKDETLLGTLSVYRQEVRPFTDKQIALLQNFAAQAVIAMENARLITETREALEQQTATAEVLGVINSSPGDLQPVFDAMLDKALRLCDANFGFLMTYDGEALHSAADRGHPEFAGRIRGLGPIKPEAGTANARILEGESLIHVIDAANDPRHHGDSAVRRAVVEIGGFRTLVSIALRKDDVLLGIIHIFRQQVRPFSDKQIALLQNFAAQAVVAMENARLLGELRKRTEEVAELNRGLEARVAEAVDELGRVGRLKRFLAPQLAELIVSQGDEKILESHRREIVVVFCDLRGYTAFTETAEPEEVLDFLREYHGALGPLVSQFEGTLDQFSGDGIMVFFNDPVPVPDPAERAVKMAIAMREEAGELISSWRRRRGRMLGFGAGIAQGYATLGQIGFAERSGYTAIGTVCNLAARLCAEAKDGQILLAQRVAVAVQETTPLEEIGELILKGLTQPVVAYNVLLAASQPALRVIEGGPAPESV